MAIGVARVYTISMKKSLCLALLGLFMWVGGAIFVPGLWSVVLTVPGGFLLGWFVAQWIIDVVTDHRNANELREFRAFREEMPAAARGEVTGPAVDEEALDQLRTDPEAYFRDR